MEEPEEAVRCRVTRSRRELLMKWKGQPAAATSWVELDEFKQLYPEF
jgi:hypothetical protein